MKLDDSACRALLDAALDQGITLIFLTVSSACMPQASTRLPSGTADPRRYLPVSSPEHKGK